MIRKFYLLSLFLLYVCTVNIYSITKSYDLIDVKRIDSLRIDFDENRNTPILLELVKKADLVIKKNKYYSVTYGNKKTLEGLNIHDFQSTSVYYWEDKDSGKLRKKDGVRNPKGVSEKLEDSKSLVNLMSDIKILSIAYYITRNEKYGDRVVSLLKTWFINPSTKMNPNMNYSQMKPNEKKGNPSGIIETRRLIYIPDLLRLISDCSGFTSEFEKDMKQWFTSYVGWLINSDLGTRMSAYKNNQRCYYFLQLLVFSKFAGKQIPTKAIIEQEFIRIIDDQIESDGLLFREVERTNAFSYCVFILKSYALISIFSNKNDISEDLLIKKNKNGANVITAFSWLRQYIDGNKEWKFSDEIKNASILQYYYITNNVSPFCEKKNVEKILISSEHVLKLINNGSTAPKLLDDFINQLFLI